MIASAEEFVRLRMSKDPEEYRRAAWEEADIAVWYKVIDKYSDMKEWVAHNKKIPDAIIRILAKDKDWRVRSTIASKRKTPPDVLASLSTDPNEGVRMDVAVNAKTPKYILESMLNDKWENVCVEVRERLGVDQKL